MRRGLAIIAIASVAVASPTVAADWTGFYAGVYSGASARNNTELSGAEVSGQFVPDGADPFPDEVVNVGGVDPAVFDILALARPDNMLFANATGQIAAGTVTYSPQPTFGAVVGYSFGNGVRVETDWSLSQFTSSEVEITGSTTQEVLGQYVGNTWEWQLNSEGPGTGAGIDVDAGYSTTANFLLGNLWYDFDNDSALTPYIGGGVGVAHVSSTIRLPGVTEQSAAWVLAGQLGAGVTIDLNDKLLLDLGYRFKMAGASSNAVSGFEWLSDVEFAGYSISQAGPTAIHTVQAGLNLRFD